jgi:hypothetical protein
VRIIFEPIDDAGDAIFDERHLKINEQAQSFVGEPKISQKRLLVNRSEHFDGFDLDNDLVLHDEVGSESGIDTDVLIDHGNRLLAYRA